MDECFCKKSSARRCSGRAEEGIASHWTVKPFGSFQAFLRPELSGKALGDGDGDSETSLKLLNTYW